MEMGDLRVKEAGKLTHSPQARCGCCTRNGIRETDSAVLTLILWRPEQMSTDAAKVQLGEPVRLLGLLTGVEMINCVNKRSSQHGLMTHEIWNP